jgi:transposase
MGKPYPEQLRRAVIQAIAEGHTRQEVAEAFEISLSSVARLLRRWRHTGDVRANKVGGHKAYVLQGHEEPIKAWIAARPGITLAELQTRLEQQNVVVGKSSIARFLGHLYRDSAGGRNAGQARRRSLLPDPEYSRTKPARPATSAHDVPAHPTRFKPGQPRPAGSGRSAGTPNRSTTILSTARLLAAEEAGDHAGKNELIEYLRTAAAEDPNAFASLFGKLFMR